MYKFSDEIIGGRFGRKFAPYIGTLFVWLVFANSFGLLGLRPITADINVTAALAAISFITIQAMSLKNLGIRGRLNGLGDPFYL